MTEKIHKKICIQKGGLYHDVISIWATWKRIRSSHMTRHGVPRWRTEVDFKSQPDLRVVGVCFENISVGNMQLLQNHTRLQVQFIQVGWGCLAIFTKSGSTQPRLSHWYLRWYFQTCWLCCGASKISKTQKSRETRGKDWSDLNYAICQGNDMEGMVIPMFMRKRYAVCV